MAVEARLGAFEGRFAALEMRLAQLEARGETAEAAVPPSAEAGGVAVRGAIRIGGHEQAVPERQPDEKTARRQKR